jgi:hypothetical protein
MVRQFALQLTIRARCAPVKPVNPTVINVGDRKPGGGENPRGGKF